MGVSNPQKTVCPEKIPCGGTFRLTLRFDAEGEGNCRDIILALDRSGSMGGKPMQQMKAAAKHLAEKLGCGNRMGLLSFSDAATEEAPLGADQRTLCTALDRLEAGGNTNHALAFCLAGEMFRDGETRKKILILFTDGGSNGGNPDPAAESLRDQGVEIFCIGLGECPALLRKWASRPWETHVICAACPCKLEEAFCTAAGALTGQGVREIRIREQVTENFRIRKVFPPSKGTARKTDDRTVLWNIESAGEKGKETLTLTMEAEHTGKQRGPIPVNACVSYEDQAHNCLTFPSPCIEIGCSCPIPCDPCPEPIHLTAEPCRDTVAGKPGTAIPGGLGRIVTVEAVIRNVCPDRALAVAVLLTEVDPCGKEHSRGLKTYEIPPQGGETCRDIILECVQFVVPESTKTWCRDQGICGERNFRARVLANYLDTDFICCDKIDCP